LAYYNADGGAASMCGNGARCAAAFAYGWGIAGKTMRIETSCGIVGARVKRGTVELDMGPARYFHEGLKVSTSVGNIEGCIVDTGVPHFVTLTRNLNRLDVDSLGRELRFHRVFRPGGVNVDFVEKNRDGSLLVRTYERGVEGETLACGTGAAAVAVCLGERGLVRSPVKIITRGGDVLRVRYANRRNPFTNILLDGPAQVIYEGDIPVSVLNGVRKRLQSGE
jgi:diaminopimelate epimerase